MTLSICPTFYCKNNCDYCYLGLLRQQKLLLSLTELQQQLDAIMQHKLNVTNINVFGGDLTLCSPSYVVQLVDICKSVTNNISLTTNVHDSYQMINYNNDMMSVSFNKSRIDYTNTLKMIEFFSDVNFALSIVVDNQILSEDIQLLLDSIPLNCKYLTFQKCAVSMYNISYVRCHDYDNRYQQFIIDLYKCFVKRKYNFKISNFDEIYDCLHQRYDATTRSNIFILPDASFSSIDYDDEREFFRKHQSLHDYDSFIMNEYKAYYKKCCACQYFGSCYTEHLNLNKTCSGHRYLLDEFQHYDLSNLH